MAKSYFKQEHDLGTCFDCKTQNYSGSWTNELYSLRSQLLLVKSWSPFVRYAEKRRAEAARIREKYPDRIPVRMKLNYKEFFFLLVVIPLLVNVSLSCLSVFGCWALVYRTKFLNFVRYPSNIYDGISSYGWNMFGFFPFE